MCMCVHYTQSLLSLESEFKCGFKFEHNKQMERLSSGDSTNETLYLKYCFMSL